jgi:hyperosmotically inducible protein
MILTTRLVLLLVLAAAYPTLADTASSEQSDKDKASEKSAPRSPNLGQAQPAPESQPSPPKPSVESKPPAPTGPPAKADTPQERDLKEKESPRKPVSSLIITVKLALMADPRLFQYEIEAEEDKQTITLRGRVSSEEEKSAASEIARAVAGVKAVINKLEVSKDLLQALTKKRDEVITHLIKERFGKSATLKAANFEVKTEEGIVSLSGVVRFQVIALEAAEAARQVPGVKAVKTEKVRLEGEG